MTVGRETDIKNIQPNDLNESEFIQTKTEGKTPAISRKSKPEDYIKALEELIRQIPVITLVRPVGEGGTVEVMSVHISTLGYSPEDFTSGRLTYEDMIYPEDVQGVMLELLENTREGAYEVTQIYRMRTERGEIRPVEEHTLIHRDERGEPLYYLTIVKLLG
ncbi:PAS domain-containing protein [Methanolobus sp.]|uniref:PAS domain-containing protein n=1 Tax=Methanolobus sp. TaxID=1874737 RepID=UPI0025E2902F|nr:PAS domain-containing protein [Methanolobus sp.]